MSDWIKNGPQEAYWEACRTAAQGHYIVEGCWAWTVDQEPSEDASFEVATVAGQTEAEVIKTLNAKYIDWCSSRGFTPRETYGFEGVTDTISGRAVDLRT